MIRLFDNPFSPFARKVRLVLATKGLAFESIDALALDRHAELLRVNPRAEVPVLEDDGFVVVNSAEIAAYLEDRYPDPPVFPANPRERARAHAWGRFADTVIDAVIHDVSLWTWPTHRRADAPPAGLVEAGRRDLAEIAARLESDLGAGAFLCGERATIADFALFPHVPSWRAHGAQRVS